MLTARTRSGASPYNYPGPMWKLRMDDWVNDRWKYDQRDGVLSCNPMDHWAYRFSGLPPTSVHYNAYYRASSSGPWVHLGLRQALLPPPPLQFTNSAGWSSDYPWNTALQLAESLGFYLDDPAGDGVSAIKHTELSDRLASGIALVGVSYIERLKTLRMFKEVVSLLKNPFINARNFLKISRNALRGNPHAFRTVMNEANEKWLQGRYGWRPLAFEVMAMLDAAQQGDNQRVTVRSWNGAPPFSTLRTLSEWSAGNGLAIRWMGEFSGSRIARYGQTGDFNFSFSNWARNYGLYDVVGTAWEVVPYSFVLDWYINVGHMLGALQAHVMLDERVGWDKDLTQYSNRMFPILHTNGELTGKGTRYVFSHFDPPGVEGWERATFKYRRVVDDFTPVIDFKCNIDALKIIDQISLLYQATLGSQRRR